MLLPVIDEQFAGVIWRMEIDGLSDSVFLETRTEDKQTSFSSFNLLTGAVNFTDFTTPERWLTGIEAAYDGMLLLHNYQSENSPAHKGITAVNLNGDVSWSNYTYALDHLTINGPAVFNTQIQPKKFFLIDVKTGERVRNYEQTVDNELETPIQFPQIVDPDTIDLPLGLTPHGNIVHYFHYNKFRIVSLHTFIAGQLKHHLYIYDGDALVYEDLLSADIQKMQPESFILYKNSLIYIKNKSVLKVLTL